MKAAEEVGKVLGTLAGEAKSYTYDCSTDEDVYGTDIVRVMCCASRSSTLVNEPSSAAFRFFFM